MAVVSASPSVKVTLHGAWEMAFAGERFALTVEVQRPPAEILPVCLHRVDCKDREIHLEPDLLQSGVLISPGETYRFLLPITVARPQNVSFSAIQLILGTGPKDTETVNDPVPLGTSELEFKPSLSQEIQFELQSLCQYPDGTKVRLLLAHKKNTSFTNLQLDLKPASSLCSGKSTFRLAEFVPNQKEELELIVSSSELTGILTADAHGTRSEYHRKFVIEAPPPVQDRLFRFLEPRRLGQDEKKVFEVIGLDQYKAVSKSDEVNVLHAGSEYQITITPHIAQGDSVLSVNLEEFEGMFRLRKEDKRGGSWYFNVEIHHDPLWSKPDRLNYEVEYKQGKQTGEIPLCIRPSHLRQLLYATTLGFALTIQGIASLRRVLTEADYSPLEAVANFQFKEDYPAFAVLSIPLIWLALRLLDMIQYPLRR